ncbi:transposable element Tc1 transposase [Trichonephila clavipes]|nr:transposable element Tc1 transposase [Trichonephila clavipes]
MWKTVLWSDESRFTVWQLDGRVWVWRMPGERFFSDCVVPTVKLGGGSIMMRGCFSWFGLGPLVPVIGNMNSEMYVDIFWTMLKSQLYGNISGKGHLSSSRITAPFTHRGCTDVVWRNGCSKTGLVFSDPDQNPIEHLWDELERGLRSQPNRPSSLQALTSAVMDAWMAIPMVTYQKLVESLPKRLSSMQKRGTNIVLICASGRSKPIQVGVRILLAK